MARDEQQWIVIKLAEGDPAPEAKHDQHNTGIKLSQGLRSLT